PLPRRMKSLADETQKLLKQMREERGKRQADPTDYYAKLRIYKNRRRALPFILALCFVLFAGMISTCMKYDHHWMTVLGPVMIVGGLLALLPLTEEWIYTPWQSSSQKYERH